MNFDPRSIFFMFILRAIKQKTSVSKILSFSIEVNVKELTYVKAMLLQDSRISPMLGDMKMNIFLTIN